MLFRSLRKMGIECVPKRRTFKAPEGAQAGHPAITPTHWEVASAGDTADERKLYELIRLQALACQAPDAQYATRKAVLDANAGHKHDGIDLAGDDTLREVNRFGISQQRLFSHRGADAWPAAHSFDQPRHLFRAATLQSRDPQSAKIRSLFSHKGYFRPRI